VFRSFPLPSFMISRMAEILQRSESLRHLGLLAVHLRRRLCSWQAGAGFGESPVAYKGGIGSASTVIDDAITVGAWRR